MNHDYGNSLCISTQVGCNMSCAFCESGRLKKVRNLESCEMVEQILQIEEELKLRITHLVLMGIGEPFDNYDNVVKFLRLITNTDGFNVSERNISLSTCGLVDRIKMLMEEDLPITLSISLHAPDDETRSAIMPINNRWGVAELLDTCRAYFAHTGRKISFEYTLISGKNDSREAALSLAALLNKHLRSATDTMPIHVNLIPVNPVTESGFSSSEKKTVEDFAATLERKGIRATVRRTLGADINASCGQLRREEEQNKN